MAKNEINILIVMAILLIAVPVGATNSIATNASSNNTPWNSNAFWTEPPGANLSISTGTGGSTIISITVDTRLNGTNGMLFGRVTEDGTPIQQFNVTADVYSGVRTFIVNNTETVAATHQYGASFYSNLGRMAIINRWVMSAQYLQTGSFAPTPDASCTGSNVPQWNGTAWVCNIIPAAGSLTYYFQNITSTSTINASKQMLTLPNATETELTFTNVTNNQVLQNFTTEPGSPGLKFIPAGSWEYHQHANKTGTAVSIFADVYEVNATGYILQHIGSSETSTPLVAAETEYRLFFVTANTTFLTSNTSRIMVAVTTTSVTGTPSVHLELGNDADSHLTFPSNTVDGTNFVPYNGATADVNLGTYNLTANSVSGNLSGNGSALTNIPLNNGTGTVPLSSISGLDINNSGNGASYKINTTNMNNSGANGSCVTCHRFLQTNGNGSALTNIPLNNGTGTVSVANGGTNATDAATARTNLGIINTFGMFGDGADGNVTISTNTTLSSNKFYNNLTVNSNITLNTSGYVVFVAGTLTLNGNISNSANGTIPAANGTLKGGGAGAAPACGSGCTGNAGPGVIGQGGNGGNGGADSGGGQGGGSGGTVTKIISGYNVSSFSDMEANPVFGGTGGGSGGGGGGGVSGGGGGGGGVVIVLANIINISSTGNIMANGGVGGVPTGGFCGGGGGGGGGNIIIYYTSLTNNGSIQVNGGAGGAGLAGGSTGGTGANGNIIYVTV